MGLPEGVKFIFCSCFFLRGLTKALISFVQETKKPVKNDALKGINLNKELPKELPTIIDIKKALPKHCFQPKVSTSLYYAAKDLGQVFVAFYITYTFHAMVPSTTFYWITLCLYWAIQGTFFTAIFVCGHDGGHGSFSNYPLLNDTVGTIMHCFLLVPFYQWKLSHHHHHKHTGNMDKDEVFYPVREEDAKDGKYLLPVFGLGMAWFIYLISGYNPRRVHHYTAYDPMFVGHVTGCLFSLGALGAMASLLFWFYANFGLWALFVYYLVPEFIFASFLVIITFLHHTEVNIPWYADDEWNFVKGQLSTIDRDYGIVHETIHNIGTHQMHHMFLKIPHYYLEDATASFRAAFPELVRACDEPIMTSFLRMFRKFESQVVIPQDTTRHVFK